MDFFHISRLIISKLKGNISVSEQQLLDEWEAVSDERQSLLKSLEDEDLVKNDLHMWNQFDEEKVWVEITEKINNRSGVRRIFSLLSRIAAIFIIALLAGSVVYLSLREQSADELVVNQTYEPGTSGAVLNIAGMEPIVLNDTTNAEIDSDNEVIATVKNGMLACLAEGNVKSVPIEIIVPQYSDYHFVLSDGSEIWLNAGSKARFEQPFSVESRNIYIEGEAFFNVTHRPDQPFVVDIAGRNSIEVLGTSFNVKAYTDEAEEQAVLVDGSIRWTSTTGEVHLLEPGQLLSFSESANAAQVRDVDVYPYVSWKDGRFVFDGNSLTEIISVLNRWYGVSILCVDEEIGELHFSMDVNKQQQLDEILDIIETTGKVKFTYRENQILAEKN
ncbi:FecR family protein [Carboxylicivirga taeanensis]|uniref:FecR family protein n=1 Tax=Carboxylicivirga taeanensis TaxID=1416875 RepID=UPI003F6DDF80